MFDLSRKMPAARALFAMLLWGIQPPALRAEASFSDVPRKNAIPVVLESPLSGSGESGIGLIRGWTCDASRLEVVIDGTIRLEMSYGADRKDTIAHCGDANNGFGAVVNWNSYGDGPHNLKALRDGVQFADVDFFVTTLGVEFLMGASGEYRLQGFPDASRDLTLIWSQPHQGFVIAGDRTPGEPADTAGDATHRLESPISGSSESGIGLIRGWVCNASVVSIVVDADPALELPQIPSDGVSDIVFEAPYGTERKDTLQVCGDVDNGWGMVVNWNDYPPGVHRLRAYADGVVFADVHFNTANLGVSFLRDVGTPSRILNDFPAAGQQLEVTWSQPHQGVVITHFWP